MVEKEFTHQSFGILLTTKGKEVTDYTDWGTEPLYKKVYGIGGIHINRKYKTGKYISLATLRQENPTLFPGIESFSESIQGELVIGYRDIDKELAKQTVTEIARIIKDTYIEPEVMGMLEQEEDE